MQLKTWSFAKKHNSTARPTGYAREYAVTLKEDTDIDAPVFIIGTGIDAGINYCQWDARYYFIERIVILTKDQVELHCMVDVLATYKDEIGAYTCHIDRAASVHNPYLIDSALSASQHVIHEAVASTDLFDFDATGCFLVRIVSPGGSPTGITTWVMSESDLDTLLDFLTTDSNFTDVLTDSIVKTFFNPFQYIVSIKWFPFAKNDIAGSSDTLRIGWWQVPGSFKRLTSVLFYDNVTVNKPTAYYSGDFRAYTKEYTRLTADIPNIGVVELDPMMLSGTIRARVCIDWITGEMRVTFGILKDQGGVDVMADGYATYTGTIGVDINVGQTTGMTGQMLAGASGMGVGEAALSGLVAGASDLINGIRNSLFPTSSVIGSSGNKAAIISNPRLLLFIRSYGCGEFPNTVYGRPLRANRMISTLSGYAKCLNASIALSAPVRDIDAVNGYLNGGFYYE